MGVAAAALAALGVFGAARSLAVGRSGGVPREQRGPGGLDPGEGGAVLHVPFAPGAIALDGDTDDPGWTRAPGPARTGAFLTATGAPARPFSEVRAVWGDGQLYLSLYAADDDIEARTEDHDGPVGVDDAFRVTFARSGVAYVIDVSPKGVVADAAREGDGALQASWESGAHVSPEIDGTLNHPGDSDEEWVVEMAVPLASIGMAGERGERVAFSVSRCDAPAGGTRECAGWGPARLVLE